LCGKTKVSFFISLFNSRFNFIFQFHFANLPCFVYLPYLVNAEGVLVNSLDNKNDGYTGENRLRGVNLGGWFSQVDCIEEKDPSTFPGVDEHMATFLTEDDFAQIAKWGFNHVRLPVDYFNFFSDDGVLTHPKRLDLVDRAVSWADKYGLKTMFDLHKCPGHDFYHGLHHEQKFFTDPVARKAAKNTWSVLAERFGDNTSVLLEILNEPVAPNNEVWNRVKDEMAAHIRSCAPKSTIVVGSNLWNAASEFAELSPLEDDNILYSFHFYNPVTFTHQQVPWHPEDPGLQVKREYPGDYKKPEGYHQRLDHDFGLWNRQTMADFLAPVTRFREKYQVPVACGEFGVFVQAPRESQLRWMDDFLSILRDSDIGYSYWNYKNLDFGLISEGEQLHQDLPQYQNDQRLDRELTEKLVKG